MAFTTNLRRIYIAFLRSHSHIGDPESSELIEKTERVQGSLNLSHRTFNGRSWILTGLNGFILCLTLLTIILVPSRITDADAIRRTQSYSPVFRSSIPNLTPTILNGSLFNYPPRLNRNGPSPALDAEWERMSEPGWILISREDIVALGKDPSTRARPSTTLLTAMGYGPDAELYLAQIDAFHQIHCLNAIRKHAFWDVYYRPEYGAYDAHTPENMHWTHLSHCLDMLYQNLVCSASADIITGIWMEDIEHPMPDFDVRKQCGSMEHLLDWSYAHEVPRELEHLMVQPVRDDIGKLFPMPLELFRAVGKKYPAGLVVDHDVPDRKFWYSSW